jgi:hypothetical protein
MTTKRLRTNGLAVLLVSGAVLAGANGCSDRRPVTPIRNGLAECAELERTCEAPARDLGEPYRTCYETGASKVKNACINRYYDCIDACRSANETGGGGGEAGAARANPDPGASGASATAGAA